MKNMIVIAALVALILTLTFCAPAPTPTTTPIPSTLTPRAPTAAPTINRTLTLALSQEPDTLNPYLAAQRSAGEVHVFVIEGLLSVNAHGEFFPALAKEIPTKANGGVSSDGKTITYHLKEHVSWADGAPFTCADVQFTWQAVTNPQSGAVATTGYTDIAAVACPDPLTAVITFKNFYAPYLVPFWTILPKHATGDPAAMTKWDYNRNPLGTGPFKIVEWVSGDHITLARNENYRDAQAGKPQLDSILIRFVPSRDVALQLLQTGEVDIVWDLTEANLPQVAKMSNVAISAAPGPRAERLVLNLGDPTLDAPDAAQHPHPILGDVRVRQALELAINKREIVDKLLNGQAQIGTNELHTGWWTCDTTPSVFDPARARQLLDDAGWQTGADTIRAQGATRLRLKLQGPTGDAVREQVEQLLIEDWKAVGVQAYIENAPTSVLLGTWNSNGVARHGKYDLLMYSTGPYIDPHDQVAGYFLSANIPQASNRGAGYNYSRWSNPAADAAIQAAATSADPVTRRDAYCQAMAQVNRDLPQIYLYSRLTIAAYRDRLQNFSLNVWKNLGWNAAEWTMK